MAQVTTIPRFLLPQTGRLWRQAGTSVAARPSGLPVRIRFASSSGLARDKDGKPIVLEKPERFNPPSHGSRLPKRTTPRHYGGDLSASETQAQRVKDYPGLMAPKGTLSHWIWNSYWLHSAIAMGTLGGLAIFTFSESFKQNSPFADLLPSSSDFYAHPIDATRQVIHVMRLTEMRKAEEIQEKRARKAEDVQKRAIYRKAHGLPVEQGLPWTKSDSDEAQVAAQTPDPTQAQPQLSDGAVLVDSTEGESAENGKKKKKKWLGIF